MSQSLASAKKRRAPAATVAEQQQLQQQLQPNQSMANSNLLTLPQVIQIVDKRLIILEKFMNDSSATMQVSEQQSNEQSTIPDNFKEIIDEFDKRYELLAEEIVNIKNIVLSLQSYTMEVNKTLMEERVRIFSDLEDAQLDASQNI